MGRSDVAYSPETRWSSGAALPVWLAQTKPALDRRYSILRLKLRRHVLVPDFCGSLVYLGRYASNRFSTGYSIDEAGSRLKAIAAVLYPDACPHSLTIKLSSTEQRNARTTTEQLAIRHPACVGRPLCLGRFVHSSVSCPAMMDSLEISVACTNSKSSEPLRPKWQRALGGIVEQKLGKSAVCLPCTLAGRPCRVPNYCNAFT